MPKLAGYIVFLIVGVLIGWSARYFIEDEATEGKAANTLPPIIIRTFPPEKTSKIPDELTGRLEDKLDASSNDEKLLESGLTPHQLSLLGSRQYKEFVEQYWNEKNPQRQRFLRNKILDFTRDYLDQEKLNDARELIDAYLSYEYRDAAALNLKIELQLKYDDYFEVIKTYYALYGFEHQPEKLQELTQKIRNTVSVFSNKLDKSGQYQGKLELYSFLVDAEPGYAPYFVELAKTQMRLNKNDEARQSLLLVEHDARVTEQVQNLLQQINQPPGDAGGVPVMVPLSKIGEHFVVDALVNDSVSIRLLIDTGASTTVVKSEIIDAYFSSVPVHNVVRFSTANGLATANLYRFNSISINELEVGDILVGGLQLDNMPFADGLLGMNFLKHYRFYIDQNQQMLKLIPLE